ncbi:MAG: hypothetical protein M1830_000660 [Pleopsidium flavum]|nr:MAG: hypothetical protein M1830_000660 [Pleopsidium flavum]
MHHMKRAPLQYVNRRDDTRPLKITNNCPETIYPGLATQAGTLDNGGFELSSGSSQTLDVSADWQGRVWGRTNCSFNTQGTGAANNGGYNGGGSACLTGDCNGIVNCKVTGNTPVTLAEFTLASTSGQTFYDISLVDGYNIPMGIVSLHTQSGNSSITNIPPNLTNPVCIGTAALLADEGSTADATLGTNSSFPLPLDQSVSMADVQRWCPWDLQLQPPTKPGDGIFTYPDTNIQRPLFNPCYSTCAKYNQPRDCCTGSYGSPNVCKPSLYSQDAKKVCPDAYSFGKLNITRNEPGLAMLTEDPAFDDQTSTFIIPSGGGFEVIFCPAGRSTTILTTKAAELHQLATSGQVTPSLLAETQIITITKSSNDSAPADRMIRSLWALFAVVAFAIWSGGWL